MTRTDTLTTLGTDAARQLATTTKTAVQMRAATPRWLLRVLPWVEVSSGTYRVNRRLPRTAAGGPVEFCRAGSGPPRVVPERLTELPALRHLDDLAVLESLADRCVPREFTRGDLIASAGHPIDSVLLIARGRVSRLAWGPYDDETFLGILAEGDAAGAAALERPHCRWPCTLRALTGCTVLALPLHEVRAVAERSAELRRRLDAHAAERARSWNPRGEADLTVASGHVGEPQLPGTFADLELAPREYELSVAQTVLRVHTRVADLYNEPVNQVEEQLRLTVEALRERQEHEMVNNREFGLLHHAAPGQRIHPRIGPPTPDDLDELLARRRRTRYLLAHPRTIAAFGRQCSSRGIHPDPVEEQGRTVHAWRGVPLLPCDKIPVTAAGTGPVLALRVGTEHQGVVGLHHTGLPGEYRPGLNVRFMGIDDRGVLSYLVSAYYSVAVPVPDALGVLRAPGL